MNISGLRLQFANATFKVLNLAPQSLVFCTVSALAVSTVLAVLAAVGSLRYFNWSVDWSRRCVSFRISRSSIFIFISCRAEQSKRSGSSNKRLTVYDWIHDHCWGRRDVILNIILKVVLEVVLDVNLGVILILCHSCVHIAVELTLC